MIRKILLLWRGGIDLVRCSVTEQDKQMPFLAGCVVMMVVGIFTFVPVAIYLSGGGAISFIFHALIAFALSAVLAPPIALGIIRHNTDSTERKQMWKKIEAEYGGT